MQISPIIGRFFILLTFIFSFSYAQNLGGGLVLGFNASQVDGDEFGGFNKGGLQLGGFVTYNLSDNVKLQPEILFDQLGSGDGQIPLIKTNYISVPILLNFKLPILIGDNEHQIEIHTGPVLGILLSAKNDPGDDFSEQFDNPDLRGVAGIAYRIGNLNLSVRYGYSLTSFTKNNSNLAFFQPGIGTFHNYASFSLRWHIFD